MDPREKVQTPATLLQVTAGIGIVVQLLSMTLNLLGVGLGGMTGGQEGMINMASGVVGLFFNIIGMIVAVVIWVGASKMKRLESYSFAMTASIIAMLPCISPCCLIGLPVGIWSLVTLMAEDVKAAFR